jgi:hypothetical protein
MTVLEQCSNARTDIERYAVLRKSETDARALRELHMKVREHCDALHGVAERLAVLRERQIRIPGRLRTERLLDNAAKLRDEVAATLRRPADAANFLRSFKKLSEDALSSLEAALDGYISESKTVDAATLRQLEQIPRFAQQVQTLRDLQRTTSTRAAQLPVDELRVFLERYARVRESLRDVEDLPAEVKTFLKEVDKGGARLELLTESVREWLATKKLIGNVRIVIAPHSN